VSRQTVAAQITATRDSIFAQAIADAEGPGVSISAQYSNLAGSRRVRATFHLDADAYVIVGHIDADGVLRIAFPGDPKDDGLVKGNKTYQTQEFFAGFTDQYRYRVTSGMFQPVSSRYDSYDGGLGYVFIIASWRPMRFDRFQTGGDWDTFEIADEQYLRDPRPAIYELASLLVGENREAYTVKFARYFASQNLYPGFGAYSNSAFGLGFCSGYSAFNYGFASSPFDRLGSVYSAQAFNRESFYYRGRQYYYNAAGDCYQSGFPGYRGGGYYGYQIATGPVNPGTNPPTPKRAFDPDHLTRNPLEPRQVAPHVVPGGRIITVTEGIADRPRTSPVYRERGLLTSDDGQIGVVGRREPRIDARNVDPRAGSGERTRPSIQEMVNRQPPTPVNESRGYSRARAFDNDRSSYTPASRSRMEPSSSSSSGGGGGYSPAASRSEPSSSSSGSGSPPAAPPASSGASGSGSRPPGTR
jgi:hypothetical protein